MIDPTEELVTVFGGGGFIGRYVCEFLLKSGVRVRVAQRKPRQAYIIQPLGQVGQFGFVEADITDPQSVARALKGASAAVNLVGSFKKMQAVHVDGARNIAEAARQVGARALVHVSAIGADVNAASTYGRTKGQGEEAVKAAFPEATIIRRQDENGHRQGGTGAAEPDERCGEEAVKAAFPEATIIRPSLVFGPEDELTNRFAGMARLPFLPVIAATRKFQPVYVRDLGEAIARAALEPERYAGTTYEIGGPQVMSMADLHQAVLEITGQQPEVVHMPDLFGSLLASFGWLPGAPLTRDQWQMLQHDNVPSGEFPGLEAFGIRPTPLAAVGMEWLGRFHKGGKFAGRRINLTATN